MILKLKFITIIIPTMFQILQKYDMVALQEIQDEEEEFIHLFVDELKK